MPRAKSDSIVTHRIELGKWERDKLAPAIQLATYAGSIGVVGVGAGAALAAYGLWWFFDAGWGIGQNIKDAAADYWEGVKTQGNVLYLSPLELDLDDPDVQARLDEADGDPLIWNYPKQAWNWLKGGLGL